LQGRDVSVLVIPCHLLGESTRSVCGIRHTVHPVVSKAVTVTLIAGHPAHCRNVTVKARSAVVVSQGLCKLIVGDVCQPSPHIVGIVDYLFF